MLAFLSTFIVAAILVGLDYWTKVVDAPLRAGVIFWALTLILVVGGRFAARMFLIRRNQDRESVIVYGAWRCWCPDWFPDFTGGVTTTCLSS